MAHVAAGAHGLDEHVFRPDAEAGVHVGSEVGGVADAPRARPRGQAGGNRRPRAFGEFRRGRQLWRLGILRL